MLELLVYLAVGTCAGLIAGLLGAGGGAIIIPPLLWIFARNDIPVSVAVHMAIGTSLATIVITALASIRAHHRRGAVMWPVFIRLSPGIISGALLGAIIADALNGEVLRFVFSGCLLLLAFQIGIGFKPTAQQNLPGILGLFSAGMFTGAVSAIIGIGGAALIVPFFLWCNLSVRNAVATSAACGLPLALAGSSGYIFMGWSNPELPTWSAGYVYGPALVGIATASMVFAPLGARLAHTLPTGILRKIFAAVLAIISINMMLN